MRPFTLLLLAAGVSFLPRGAAATPIYIHFEGVLQTIDDTAGLAAGLGLLEGDAVEAVYELDPEAGLVRFGDGRYGARPSGGRVEAGSYRAGAGEERNVWVFDDCWVGDLACIEQQGGDAYVVELAGRSLSGVDYELLIELSGLDDSVLGGNREVSPLPPDPRLFQMAGFELLLTDGLRRAELAGAVVSLRPVSEPSTFLLLGLGVFLLSIRSRDSRTLRESSSSTNPPSSPGHRRRGPASRRCASLSRSPSPR